MAWVRRIFDATKIILTPTTAPVRRRGYVGLTQAQENTTVQGVMTETKEQVDIENLGKIRVLE